MSNERMAALEAVAEAARKLDRFPSGVPGDGRIVRRADLEVVWDALDALDALPAPATEPAGDVVGFVAFEDPGDGEWRFVRRGTSGERRFSSNGWTRRGAVKLTVERGE